jgi:UDP-N-acetylglucosamine--N-acetylmuramyl-(pentapeptide) pyrophosphoryl-undecaprenol N-acetylglucosamine transferase
MAIESKEKKYMVFITGGHATPAVACINELRSRGYNNLIYIGQKKTILFDKNPSSEYKMIKERMGLNFKPIVTGKLSSFIDLNSFIWLARLPAGFVHAFYYHIRYRPRIVLTFGSFVGLPVAFWAWVFRTPIIAHEQTVTLGRANKIIQWFATKVCYSWQQLIDDGDKEKTEDIKSKVENPKFIYTGNPIRKEIFNVKTDVFSFSDKTKKTVFVTGGNQGAHAINSYIFDSLSKIIDKYNVIHQTGSNTIYNDFEKAHSIAQEVNKNGITYIPVNYIFVEEMAEAYKKSFVIISRAGANTVTELLALKQKAILIPIPTTSGDEQFLNAELLRKLGLAIVVGQTDLERMEILKLLAEAETLVIKDEETVSMISAMHRDAEKRIVDIVENQLKKISQ